MTEDSKRRKPHYFELAGTPNGGKLETCETPGWTQSYRKLVPVDFKRYQDYLRWEASYLEQRADDYILRGQQMREEAAKLDQLKTPEQIDLFYEVQKAEQKAAELRAKLDSISTAPRPVPEPAAT